jgi:hypothetical protein
MTNLLFSSPIQGMTRKLFAKCRLRGALFVASIEGTALNEVFVCRFS